MTGFCLQARHPRHRNSDSVPENIAVFLLPLYKSEFEGKGTRYIYGSDRDRKILFPCYEKSTNY